MRFIRLTLLFALLVVSIGVMPVAAQAADGISCDGTLYVTVTLNPNDTYDYRLDGSGPGLPTASQLVQGDSLQSITSTITFELYGPGTWYGITLQFSDPGANDWSVSGFNSGLTASCNPTGCVANVNIPAQAVGGTFNSNSEIYWAPGQLATDAPYIEAGNSYLVAGQDATGMYRQVLLACEWVWVRAETVGPNFDEVWNGAPLPTTVVE